MEIESAQAIHPKPNQNLLSLFNLTQLYNKYKTTTITDTTFYPFITDLPGKSICTKDTTINNILFENQEQLQSLDIPTKLSQDVLDSCFLLKPGPIKGFDSSLIVLEPAKKIQEDGQPTAETIVKPPKMMIKIDMKRTENVETSSIEKKKKKKKRKHSEHGEEIGSPLKKKHVEEELDIIN